MAQRDVHEIAKGRWRHLLLAAGIDEKRLSGKHGPCPVCGGADRFRFDDKDGRGTSFCNVCGSRSGLDLVMAAKKLEFREAVGWVLGEVSRAPIVAPRAAKAGGWDIARKLWSRSHPLDGRDAASRYLASRDITLSRWPTQLRFLPNATYWHDAGRKTTHPALIAQMVSPDTKKTTVHLTYLTDDGRKAELDPCRKLAPGQVPKGGAVRLAPSAETMGIAEGIETALSASLLFEVPVWAALNAGLLSVWQPPPTVRHVIIFADHDRMFGGQAAAYALAHRLAAAKAVTAEVRLPTDEDSDWNDVLMSERRMAA